MSRASGAGAYSHGIAWPSPRPQLDGEPAGRRDEARWSCRWPCSPLWHSVRTVLRHDPGGNRTSLGDHRSARHARDLPYPPNMRIRVILAGLLLAGILAGCGVLGARPRRRPRPVVDDGGRRAGRADRGRRRRPRRPDLGRRRLATGRDRERRGPRLRPGDRQRGRPARRCPRRSTTRRSSRRRPGSSWSAATSATP